jgi:hypothetical protein
VRDLMEVAWRMDQLTKFSALALPLSYDLVDTELAQRAEELYMDAIFTFIAFALAGLPTKRMDIYSVRWL